MGTRVPLGTLSSVGKHVFLECATLRSHTHPPSRAVPGGALKSVQGMCESSDKVTLCGGCLKVKLHKLLWTMNCGDTSLIGAP